ncbi:MULTISPECIES: hypothetical protein [unclassified Kitasatospora]|uniref:hypothetical protein n=1 Tax=unclassified Kitasatospora TaxID=2633591 RepID=UPI0007104747|nr:MULTISPECIES: hypothetical protein [unclassified Kitasatospora]KQV03311.1 hypothetical protein ASC99_15965 [Kitasatospora sp. Root107]KRB66106.1 hypothetical protein ASE03_31505 [Kitasatospora sp. Root187]
MADNDAVPGIGEGSAKVVSISIPEGTLLALREAAGTRGLSAFIATAMEKRLRDLATIEYLDQIEAEHGPSTPEEIKEVADIWAAAEQKEAQWRAAG